MLGAGGAARAVVWALLREGAEVEVWNRTELRSRHLCEELGGEPVGEPDQAAYELIVNSTAVGLGGEDPFAELPLRADGFAPGQVVVDMVYGGEPTALLRGRRRGRRRRRRRHRDPRPAGRPLAARSGPAASRRSRRCAPPPAAERRAV